MNVAIYIDGVFSRIVRDDLDPETPLPDGVELWTVEIGPTAIPIDLVTHRLASRTVEDPVNRVRRLEWFAELKKKGSKR